MMSHSTRVRGLKFISFYYTFIIVALYTSAWIEIELIVHLHSLRVALYTSAWIEISLLIPKPCTSVALYTSAWIEI